METKSIDLCGKEISSLKRQKFKCDARLIEHIDLTENQLSSAEGLQPFLNLNTLIIDNNNFTSLESFPRLAKL